MSNTQLDILTAIFNDFEGPAILQANVMPESALLSLHIPTDLSWFDGHFPDAKVLPGVVQVDWAGKLGKALFPALTTFQQLGNIKFKTMIMPDTQLTLELQYNESKGSLKFQYFNANNVFSTGSIKFTSS